jgi:hypothetical protein
MKKTSTHLLLALALALLAGCSSSDTGSARFAVSVPQALSSSLSRVSVTTSAPDSPSVSVNLVFSNGVWGGFLGNLSAGPQRTFLAQAFDASGTRLFEGSVSDVSIVANQTALVALTLQQVHAPPSSLIAAPVIDSLVAPSSSVHAGGALSLVATAHDPNPGDTLSYVWSSTAGSFSSASEASTSWTAPASTGIQTLTFTVTDSGGLSSSVSLAVYVGPSALQGTAQVSISINTFPQVTALSASSTRVAVGQMTSVSASASDLDGDSLTYAWSASCPGAWTQASSPSARFTPSTLPVGTCNNCRLTVAVSDGRGGQTTGTVALCVSNTPAVNHLHPLILSSSRSADTASVGQVLTYAVVASDPEGSALSFSWADNAGGAFGTPTTDSTSSRITWTAPSCVRASAPATITATVTNAFNLKATQRFSVTGLPICPPPRWAPTGSMLVGRSSHTATVLLNGKVLVVGDDGLGRAEVYDPASGTWSATGSLASTPYYALTATLLPNGTVLVRGFGETGEVYDPASGTWSATGRLLTSRYAHTATLLPNGKVLTSGGIVGSPDNNLATAELYDPASGTWSATGSMTWRRYNHTATPLLDGRVLVTGGYGTRGNLATAEVYDPASGTWSTTGSMATARTQHTATLLPDGRVLVSGGYYNLATAEVYDPASGTWSPTGAMSSPRSGHMATPLHDGRVLVTGSSGSGGTPWTAEEYDPATGTWSTVTFMTVLRRYHGATRLPDGRVLVTGGYNAGPVTTAELYTP